MSALATTTARHKIKDVATATARPLARAATPKPFLRFSFQLHPKPINATTHAFTEQVFKDPTHPNHIAIRRRLAAFDPTILHWSVKASLELSKKAVVRRWAVRRVKEAFRAELGDGGYDANGRLLDAMQGRYALKGALAMQLDRNLGAVLANGGEVREEARRVLDHVIGVVRRDASSHNLTQSRGEGTIRKIRYEPDPQARHGA